MAIHESGEDYLEAILMIKKRNGNVRSIDIAHELSFSKPSVSVAMKNLKASNYITIDENGPTGKFFDENLAELPW